MAYADSLLKHYQSLANPGHKVERCGCFACKNLRKSMEAKIQAWQERVGEDESHDFPVRGCSCVRCERVRKNYPNNPETNIGGKAHGVDPQPAPVPFTVFTAKYEVKAPKSHTFESCNCSACMDLRKERNDDWRKMQKRAENLDTVPAVEIHKYVKRIDSTVGDHDNRLDALDKRLDDCQVESMGDGHRIAVKDIGRLDTKVSEVALKVAVLDQRYTEGYIKGSTLKGVNDRLTKAEGTITKLERQHEDNDKEDREKFAAALRSTPLGRGLSDSWIGIMHDAAKNMKAREENDARYAGEDQRTADLMAKAVKDIRPINTADDHVKTERQVTARFKDAEVGQPLGLTCVDCNIDRWVNDRGVFNCSGCGKTLSGLNLNSAQIGVKWTPKTEPEKDTETKMGSGPDDPCSAPNCPVCQPETWRAEMREKWSREKDAPPHNKRGSDAPYRLYPVKGCDCPTCDQIRKQHPDGHETDPIKADLKPKKDTVPNCWCGQKPNVEPDGSLWCPVHKGKTWSPSEWSEYVAQRKADPKCAGNPFYCSCDHHQDAREAMGLKRTDESPKAALQQVAIVLSLQTDRFLQAHNDIAMYGTPQDNTLEDILDAKKGVEAMSRRIFGLIPAKDGNEASGEAPPRRRKGVHVPASIFNAGYQEKGNQALWGKTESEAFTSNKPFPVEGCNCNGCDEYRKHHPEENPKTITIKGTAEDMLTELRAKTKGLTCKCGTTGEDVHVICGDCLWKEREAAFKRSGVTESNSRELWGYCHIMGRDKPRQDPGNHDADKAPVRGCSCEHCEAYRERLNIGRGTVKEYASKAAIQLYYQRETLLKARNKSQGDQYLRFDRAYNALDTLRLDLQQLAQSQDTEHWGHENPDAIGKHLARIAPVRGCNCRTCKGYRGKYPQDKKTFTK